MTPLQAKAILEDILTRPSFKLPLTPDGEAINAAVKFIEENYFEWVPIQGDAGCQALPPEGEVVMLCYEVSYIPGNHYYAKAYIFDFGDSIKWLKDDHIGFENDITPIAWKRLPKLVKYEPAETQPEAPKTSGTLAPDLTQDTTVIFNINHKQ